MLAAHSAEPATAAAQLCAAAGVLCEAVAHLAGDDDASRARLGMNKALFMNNEFQYGLFRLFKLMIRAGPDYSYS
eukprot:2739672-Prymnesium_polylepis.1